HGALSLTELVRGGSLGLTELVRRGVLRVTELLGHRVLLLRSPFLRPALHVGLLGELLQRLAHLLPGVLYRFTDRIWLFAHSTSSFTDSTVCSGTAGPPFSTFFFPVSAATPATPPNTPVTIRAPPH